MAQPSGGQRKNFGGTRYAESFLERVAQFFFPGAEYNVTVSFLDNRYCPDKIGISNVHASTCRSSARDSMHAQ